MRVSDILAHKGDGVRTIARGAPLATAVGLMAAAQIGALVVDNGDGRVEGMLSERDVVLAVARWGTQAASRTVGEAMVADPMTADANDPVLAVMADMTHRRARHVPVVRDGRLAGILSIGDVLKSRLDEKTQENLVLQDMARWSRAG